MTTPATLAIPTEDGGVVEVEERGKTVAFGGEEVEVRRLSPEEKQRRRFIKNIVMAILGVLLLTIVTMVLMMFT